MESSAYSCSDPFAHFDRAWMTTGFAKVPFESVGLTPDCTLQEI